MSCRAQTVVWHCKTVGYYSYGHTASLCLCTQSSVFRRDVVSVTSSLPLMLPARPGPGTDRSPIMTWWLFTSPLHSLALSLFLRVNIKLQFSSARKKTPGWASDGMMTCHYIITVPFIMHSLSLSLSLSHIYSLFPRLSTAIYLSSIALLSLHSLYASLHLSLSFSLSLFSLSLSLSRQIWPSSMRAVRLSMESWLILKRWWVGIYNGSNDVLTLMHTHIHVDT